MKRIFIFLACSLWGALSAQADVRVLLFQTQILQTLIVSAPGGARIFDLHSDSLLMTLRPHETASIQRTGASFRLQAKTRCDNSNPIRIEAARTQAVLTLATPGTPPRAYAGWIELHADPHALRVINQVTDEAYLDSVVANEIPANWPAGALKAQAVLARTYLACHRGRHKDQGADACDLTHCQVYKGEAHAAPVAHAIQATRGLVLTYQRKPIDAVFHSTCGGKTTDSRNVWPAQAAVPYLIPVSDRGPQGDFCQASPYHDWTFDISREALGKQLKAHGVIFPSSMETIRILRTDTAGRVQELQLIFTDHSTRSLGGDTFYRAWGQGGNWHQLKSTWFSVKKRGELLHFQGRGLGHGVGLCQWGARGRALTGQAFNEILQFYFPGTQLESR
jgi:stage II sporulation protein D